jgi:hypothetical protein
MDLDGPNVSLNKSTIQESNSVVFTAGLVDEELLPPKFDGEIIFRSARGDNFLRVTSVGFYVTIAGIETRSEDPENIYAALAAFAKACLSLP